MSELQHHGIKGQKWGVKNGPPYPLDEEDHSMREKKAQESPPHQRNKNHGESDRHKTSTELTEKAKNGKTVTLGEKPTPKFTQFIARYLPKLQEEIGKDKQFNISVDGKRIGDAEIYREAEDSLNVVWVGVDNSARGNGYASAVMRAIVQYAKNEGLKHVTLEVPGNSPDARHIYEKLGFKETSTVSDEDDVWGGLTGMRLDLMSELQHHGIKGMKWGVRRTPEQLGHEPSAKRKQGEYEHDDYKNAHSNKSVKSMSDAELRSRLNRLNMEQQYKKMNPSKVERGRKAVQDALAVVGLVSGAMGTAIALKNNYETIKKWFEK